MALRSSCGGIEMTKVKDSLGMFVISILKCLYVPSNLKNLSNESFAL